MKNILTKIIISTETIQQQEIETNYTVLLKDIFKNVIKSIPKLIPKTFEKSDIYRVLNPTPKQQYKEAVRLYKVTKKWKNPIDKPRRKKYRGQVYPNKKHSDKEIIEQMIYLTGMCIWDIFSDNNEVISNNNKVYDLGSFRGTAGEIAEFINNFYEEYIPPFFVGHYDYCDFYMGTLWIGQRADIAPIYKIIFKTIKSWEADWRLFSFVKIKLKSKKWLKSPIMRAYRGVYGKKPEIKLYQR
ncbi:hypothetical protein ACFL56_00440 [Candidatus Margulisiibacteriota bacterium]